SPLSFRPGFSAYYNPYYPLYPSIGLRPMTPLTPAGLYPVPRLFLSPEDTRQPEVDWYGRGRSEFLRRDYGEAARDWRRAAQRELDRTLQLSPRDETARKLRVGR